MLVFDRVTGISVRPVGFLSAVFAVLGKPDLKQTRIAVSADQWQVVRGQVKVFAGISKTGTATIEPGGRGHEGVPRDRADLACPGRALEAAAQAPLRGTLVSGSAEDGSPRRSRSRKRESTTLEERSRGDDLAGRHRRVHGRSGDGLHFAGPGRAGRCIGRQHAPPRCDLRVHRRGRGKCRRRNAPGRSGPRRRGRAADAATATAGRVARCPGLRVRARHPRRRAERSGGRRAGCQQSSGAGQAAPRGSVAPAEPVRRPAVVAGGTLRLEHRVLPPPVRRAVRQQLVRHRPGVRPERPGRALDLSEHLPR